MSLEMALSSPFHLSLQSHRHRHRHCLHFPFPNLALSKNPRILTISRTRRIKKVRSVKFDDRILTSESEMTDGFFDTIEELERMSRDPSDVLNDMIERLSSRELQLVLVYFSQEGRDSYCALEVFDWLRKENRVDGETMELMVSIACGWIERLVGSDEHGVEEVVGLLNEMECVGVEAEFSMVEKVVGMYWERGKKEEAVVFVKDVVRRGGVGVGEGESGRGGPVGYLAWKMMVDGNYMGAVRLIIEFKECGLKPEVYSYLIALTALVKEQKEFSKALRKLKGSIKSGLIAELDDESTKHLDKYQSDIISCGVCLSDWAIQEGGSITSRIVHEKLLALYTCAGYGLEAEHHLWKMRILGKEPDKELCDVVLATCASQKEDCAVRRMLAGIESLSAGQRRKTLSWLIRGYVKGGYFLDASETLIKMLDSGLCPDYLDRVAVLQGLGRSIKDSGSIELYMKLCKRLSDMEFIGPCLLYLYINSYKLWIVNML